MFTFETKKELRANVRGKTIREVMVTGALADTREVEIRFTDGSKLAITVTPWNTIRLEA